MRISHNLLKAQKFSNIIIIPHIYSNLVRGWGIERVLRAYEEMNKKFFIFYFPVFAEA